MARKMYEPTEKQSEKWASYTPTEMPSDEQFKTQWAKSHHGKTTGWGMAKKQWIISSHTSSPDYQRGLWQGRVDAARGLDYSEERSEAAYNQGYHQGYTGYESNRNGWDAATRQRFDEKYLSDLQEA